jgi:hypothetical protein
MVILALLFKPSTTLLEISFLGPERVEDPLSMRR